MPRGGEVLLELCKLRLLFGHGRCQLQRRASVRMVPCTAVTASIRQWSPREKKEGGWNKGGGADILKQ